MSIADKATGGAARPGHADIQSPDPYLAAPDHTKMCTGGGASMRRWVHNNTSKRARAARVEPHSKSQACRLAELRRDLNHIRSRPDHRIFFTSQKPGRSSLTAAALSALVTATTRAASPRTTSMTSANSLEGVAGAKRGGGANV